MPMRKPPLEACTRYGLGGAFGVDEHGERGQVLGGQIVRDDLGQLLGDAAVPAQGLRGVAAQRVPKDAGFVGDVGFAHLVPLLSISIAMR